MKPVRFALSPLALVMATVIAGCSSQPPVPVVERGRGGASIPAATTIATTDAPVAPAEAPPGFYIVKKGDNLLRISLDHGQYYKDVAAWSKLDDPNKIEVGQMLRVAPPEAAAVAKPVVAQPLVASTGNTAPPPAEGGLKREPKGGVQPYSDEALARLRQPEGAKPVEKTADKPSENPADKPAEKAPAAVTTGDATDWVWPYGGTLTTPFSEGGSKGIDLSGKAGDAVNAAAAGRVNYVGTGIRGYGNLVIVKHDATYLSVYAHNSKILVKEGQTVSKGQKIAEVGSSDADSPKLHFEIRKQGKPVDPLAYLPKR